MDTLTIPEGIADRVMRDIFPELYCAKCGDDMCRMETQARWTPEQIEAYVARPISYRLTEVRTRRPWWARGPWWLAGRGPTIALGLRVNHTTWQWKPYEQRLLDHQADYDRLLASIRRDGIRQPVIGWRHPETGVMHVLVGQRRAEIAQRLGIRTLRVVEILEDVRRFWKWDVKRIDRHLKPVAGEWGY